MSLMQVGLVIGKMGETIKMLQAQTGCHIQVTKEPQGPHRAVMLEGTPEQIQVC